MSEAIPAATLVVMREAGAGPPELLIVTRAQRMAFAGGAIVFPGGRIDEADCALAAALSRTGDGAARVAAIRETIEESGVPAGLTPAPEEAVARAMQDALHAGAPFRDLLEQERLRLDLDALVPFARWKPAFVHARIFDTLFFLARVPAGEWRPRHQPGECEDALWMTAAEALARIEAGTASAIFPTKRNLERLARFASFDQAVADAASRPLELITPWVEERAGEPHVCIPEGLGYPVTSEPLATAFRA